VQQCHYKNNLWCEYCCQGVPDMPKKLPFEKKKGWLEKYEHGETEASIARKEHRDLRTVTKGIEDARMERDLSIARASVVTKAIEAHYADLLNEAERLKKVISTAISTSTVEKKTRLTQYVAESRGVYESIFPMRDSDRRMTDALLEHLGRQWRTRVEDYEGLQNTILEHLQVLQNKLTVEASKGFHEALGYKVDARGVALSGIGIILRQLQYRQNLVKTDEIIEAYKYRCEGGSAKGTLAVQWGDNEGGCRLIDGLKTEKALAKVAPIHKAILDEALKWDETASVRNLIEQRAKLAEQLEDELETRRLQRILPGRCRYCPGSKAFGAKPRRRVK
jgi:dsDNA-binding SOS-regulon protein